MIITCLASHSGILNMATVVLTEASVLTENELGLCSDAVHVVQPDWDACVSVGEASS